MGPSGGENAKNHSDFEVSREQTSDGIEDNKSELRLPKGSYPFLRIPWGLMLVEKTGLCTCGGKVKWRRRTYQSAVLILTFLVYMSYHLSRVSVGVVKSTWLPPCQQPHSNEDNNTCSFISINGTCPPGWEPFGGHNGSVTNGATLLGGMDTAFLTAYAVTMIISGMIADRTPLRYFLSIGMFGATICTALLGLAFFLNIHYYWYFILVQVTAGIFQSTGWPALVAIVGNWFGKSRRGLVMGVWNWHTSVGNLLGYLIPAIWAKPDTWGWSFISAAFIMLSICVLVFLFLPTEPETFGFKSSMKSEEIDGGETERQITSQNSNAQPNSAAEEKSGQNATKKKAIPLWNALLIPGVVEYSVALFFSKLVSYTFLFWLPFYISNERIGNKCLTPFESALLAGLFDVGAMIGSGLIGVLSDVIQSRSLSCMIFLVLALPSLFIYRSFGGLNMASSIVLIIFVGMFVNGPYALITSAVSADLGNHKKLKGEKRAMATVTAIVDATGSIGAALGPFLAGWIEDQFGWNQVFVLLMACCVFATLFISRLVLVDFIKGIKFLKAKWKSFQCRHCCTACCVRRRSMTNGRLETNNFSKQLQ